MKEYIISNIEKIILNDEKIIYVNFNGKQLKSIEIEYKNIINIQMLDDSDITQITYKKEKNRKKFLKEKFISIKETRKFFKDIYSKLKKSGFKVYHRDESILENIKNSIRKFNYIFIIILISSIGILFSFKFRIYILMSIIGKIYMLLGYGGISIVLIEILLCCILHILINLYKINKKIIIE